MQQDCVLAERLRTKLVKEDILISGLAERELLLVMLAELVALQISIHLVPAELVRQPVVLGVLLQLIYPKGSLDGFWVISERLFLDTKSTPIDITHRSGLSVGTIKVNVSYLLQLGGWRAYVHAYSSDVESLVERLGGLLGAFHVSPDQLKHAENVSYLVICSPKILEFSKHPTWLPENQQATWNEFCYSLTVFLNQAPRANSLGSSPFWWPPLMHNEDGGIGRITFGDEISSQFSAIVIKGSDDYSYTQVFLFLLFLANQWHVERGGLCVHSSAVVKGDKGFLFLGRSEAGKTTAARQSVSIGYSALGDDLNFVIRDQESRYKIAATPSLLGSGLGYSMLRPSLRGIFTLIQDNKDYLVPLPSVKVARALMESLGQVPKYNYLSDQNIRSSFQTCCNIAHRVPGYELHLRKSPDFWKLIDEQFPD